MVDRRMLGMVGRGALLVVKALGITATILLVSAVVVSTVLGFVSVFSPIIVACVAPFTP